VIGVGRVEGISFFHGTKYFFIDNILFKCIRYDLTIQAFIYLIRQLMMLILAKSFDFIVILELMLFGERLQKARKERKVSQDELAKKLGVHAPIIGRYERGEVNPSIEVAAKIADTLGISLDYLTGLSNQFLDKEIIKQINELQELKTEDQQHILKTLGALIREAKTRLTFG
jgi:transcriptional regulator with XRE-family HTH domain